MTGRESVSAPPIEILEEIDSTNAEARRRAEVGQTGPLWIMALRQTAGRGRRGRAWDSGTGNLAATHLSLSEKPPAETAQVSFVAALATADLAAAFAPKGLVSLKWPNDVLIAGRKTAGILVESGQTRTSGLWVAVGVGVNLASLPKSPERPATMLAEHMRAPPPTPPEAMEVLAAAFERWRFIWNQLGFAPIAEAWTARAHGLGKHCAARLPHETVTGIAEGLDLDGALRLRTPDGLVRRITAGDVFFEGA